jgi:translation initiation factor 1
MSDQNRKVVYSTDPDAVKQPAAREPALPANPASPLPTLQQGKPVRVHLDRKGRGGKSVSVITGVMSPMQGKKALLKLLKSKLGTGGAIKGDTLEIQGDRRDDIVVLLNDLGYQAKRAGG